MIAARSCALEAGGTRGGAAGAVAARAAVRARTARQRGGGAFTSGRPFRDRRVSSRDVRYEVTEVAVLRPGAVSLPRGTLTLWGARSGNRPGLPDYPAPS